MIKCTFILKENKIKIVDEYIFIDREFTQHEYEELVVPHMVRISANQFKK